ncbi:Periaxin [Frankliniella fusca]|uniref:Periaxin n=1 Tax=Frankliniella fusca TaxID=407009 RepID=A0AAE1H328_9NEOP|nr:Periaxin [Frankliniella fusca]
MESKKGKKARKDGSNDHEYEPISPPPQHHQGPPGPPAVHVTNIEGITIQEPPEGPDAEPIMSDNDSVGSPVRKPLEEMPVPYDGDEEDRAMSGGEMGDTNGSLGGPEDDVEQEQDDELMTAEQMQQQMEERFFAAPTPTTVRTESRTTDGEFNTSNVDSSGSGLEDLHLPLTKEGRRNKGKGRFLAGGARTGAKGAGRWGRLGGGAASSSTKSTGTGAGSGDSQAGGTTPETIQQRLRSGADRLKTRLAGISRPKIPAVRRPKFTMPDKAKFHLPDRPKFKMPERPKFKMPERPKIHLPSLPSLGRGSAATAAETTPEAGAEAGAEASAEATDGQQQAAPAAKKQTTSSRRPLKGRQYSNESTAGSSEKRRPLFDLNTFRTYPRMFRRKRATGSGGDSSSSPRSARSTRPITPPARASFSSDTVKWMRRFSDARYGAGDPVVAAIEYADHHHTPPPLNSQEKAEQLQEQQEEQQQKEQQRRVQQPAYATPSGKGDQMVYHISLHGTDSEPEYSDDQFQGPPYPEVLPIDGDLEVVDHEARKALAEAKAAAEREAAFQAQMEAEREAEEAAAQMAEYRRQAQFQQQHGRSPRHGRYPRTEADEYDHEQDASDSDRENRSSGTSSERHRRGVIEEIDSDEFFLRQKGISREDVDVGREIREALRPSADYMDDDDDVAPSPRPQRPQRGAGGTRSLARARKKKQGKIYVPARAPRATPPGDEAEEEEWEEDEPRQRQPADDGYFNTFPPDRPARRRRGKKQPSATPLPPEAEDHSQFDDEDRQIQDEIEFSVAIQRADLGILAGALAVNGDGAGEQVPPLPPRRLRKSRSSNLNVHDDMPMMDDEEEDWSRAERRVEHDGMVPLQNEADYIIPRAAPHPHPHPQDPELHFPATPQTPPVPPTRGRKSRGGSRVGSRAGSRGTSLADEDRTSRGAESLPSERGDDDSMLPDDGEHTHTHSHTHTHNEDDVPLGLGDYAFVDKSSLPRGVAPPKPERPRRPKPPRPPAPGRRAKRAPLQTTAGRLQNWRQFFSLPTRRSGKQAAKQQAKEAPVRPARNYSTLGPARPPRRRSQYTANYLEIHTDEHVKGEADLETESSRATADLHSGEVISKMKDRPLPAPPRPSRARKHQDKGDLDMEEPCHERIVPDHHHYPDAAEASQDLTYEERKAAMAQLREDFFSRSGEEPPEVPPEVPQDGPAPEPLPAIATTEPEQERAAERGLEQAEPQALPQAASESPYKSLRKKKKIPPLPQPEPEPEPEVEQLEDPRPEEVSIAIQTDPLPDDLCVEDAMTVADDMTTSASKTWPTVVERQQLEEDRLQQDAPPPPPPPPARRPRRDSQEPSAAATPATVRLELPESLQTQRLQVSDLDVDRLSVSELRANKITVSEIDGMSLSVSEVHNRSSTGLQGLQLLPGEPGSVELPSELLQQLTSLELAGAPASAPVAPPRGGVRPRAAPAPMGDSEEDEEEASLAPSHSPGHSLPRRRRPHHAAHKTPRYSSDDEDALQLQPATAAAPASRRYRPPPPSLQASASAAAPPAVEGAPLAPPSLGEASRQLTRACRVSAINALAALHQAIQPAVDSVGQAVGADPKRRDFQAALCLVLVLVTALILLGCGCTGSKEVHHHHWDFQFPPKL